MRALRPPSSLHYTNKVPTPAASRPCAAAAICTHITEQKWPLRRVYRSSAVPVRPAEYGAAADETDRHRSCTGVRYEVMTTDHTTIYPVAFLGGAAPPAAAGGKKWFATAPLSTLLCCFPIAL